MIIAELSANHGQDIDCAKALVKAAAESGADAVKVQTYTPETLTYNSNKPPFIVENQPLWKGQSLWDLYSKAYTPWEWQPELKQQTNQLGLKFIASVFDFTSVDFWESQDLEIYKIAAAEIIDIPLLKKVAQTGKPMILSTGMATMEEIDEAVDTIRGIDPKLDLTLLKCSSAYPAPIESMNLKGIKTLIERYRVKSGLSDHSLEDTIATAAVGLGGTVFEKHFKLSNGPESPDDAFSVPPEDFKIWANKIKLALVALGSEDLRPREDEMETLPFRKSLFVVKDIKKGEVFTSENIRSIRPSNGLHPRYYETVLGKYSNSDIKAGTPLERSFYVEQR